MRFIFLSLVVIAALAAGFRVAMRREERKDSNLSDEEKLQRWKDDQW